MGDFVVISSSVVRPKNRNQTKREKIHLTPWDLSLLNADYAQRGLLFLKPNDSVPESDIVSSLRSSLSLALSAFFPFSGRLLRSENHDDNTVSFLIDCDFSGAKFVHAAAKTVSVSDLIPSTGFVPSFFFPANGTKNCDGVSERLLAVQVTELKDGVFLGFGYNHLVADGTSFWQFFKTWSEICSKGSDSDLAINPPVLRLKGWFPDGIDYPIRIPLSETQVPTCEEGSVSSLETIQEKIFRFTKTNISNLKAKANEEIGSEYPKISSLQAIVGHIWHSIIKHGDLNNEEHTHCRVAVDMRSRLNPPLEPECFGNVVLIGVATSTVGDLLVNGFGWAALQVNKMVGSQTGENLRAFAESWVKNVKIPKLVVGSKSSRNSLLVASSPRFDVYGYDFGWGKPVAIRSGPGNISSGKLVMYRGTEEGSIDVHAWLSSDLLTNLLNDVDFMHGKW
ncbi:PREDICTED: uncharacterized acetyltransferase At3g50280-like [Tarenaya hassleriana]|uniref:uncharacterized acetyltransferase At3g50280-like n=1 Tax=Tarenaya hassleriana TaxID=28532 RepID=UPI00053CA2E5|nr:PREDICTED: uncharacterized acetyltransferase At3g50280-like [Tarenaya hassleriana]